MKAIRFIGLLSLAAQTLAIPARLETGNATYTNNTTPEVWRNRPALRAVPTLVTGENDSASANTSSSHINHLEPRRPPRRPGKAYWNTVYYGSWTDPAVLETLPWHSISHVLYAFASVDSNGTVYSPNKELDEKNIKLLRQVKLNHRHVRVFLSIGGYTNSQPPANQFENATQWKWRQQFADSAVDMMQNYGFDGLDIDWEYPEKRGVEFLNLLERCRWALNDYQKEHGGGFKFLMTIAISTQTVLYDGMNWPLVNGIIDAWYLMAYDYAGSWSEKSGHHANIYGSKSDAVQASMAEAFLALTERKADPRKMMLGMPLYGHSFIQQGKDFGSDFQKTEGEDDIILYKDVNPNGDWDCGVDYELIAAWCHDGERLITYDNLESVQLKIEWALNSGMRGTMFWQAEGDKPGWDTSLIEAAAEMLPGLDGYPNNLHFPLSEYDFTSWNDTNRGELEA